MMQLSECEHERVSDSIVVGTNGLLRGVLVCDNCGAIVPLQYRAESTADSGTERTE